MTSAAPMAAFVITVNVRTVSEANAHAHWRLRAARAKAQREAVGWALERWRGEAARHGVFAGGPLEVTLVRLSPRALDSDNLAGALKHVRDAIAAFLGRDDGPNSGIEWLYTQQRAKDQGVRMLIRLAPPTEST